MPRIAEWRRVLIVSTVLAAFCIAGAVEPSSGSDFTMKGPREELRVPEKVDGLETSSVQMAMLGLIGFYQHFVSPAGGPDRCGFGPSCSRFGHQAIREQGPVVGVVMTADRLTRCNIFERPGYTRLPNNKLYDPVSDNLLFEK
jgi:putative component of membrane protein insertase Oxa1/YidC/SpoIIIJ protein YidD